MIIVGDNEEGFFYGMQTLLQLLPADKNSNFKSQNLKLKSRTLNPLCQYRTIPGFNTAECISIVGRHFFAVYFIKKYIDYLAFLKYNTFHWHLTEDQGWRIEIKKYPRLTSVGGFRNGTIIGHHRAPEMIVFIMVVFIHRIK